MDPARLAVIGLGEYRPSQSNDDCGRPQRESTRAARDSERQRARPKATTRKSVARRSRRGGAADGAGSVAATCDCRGVVAACVSHTKDAALVTDGADSRAGPSAAGSVPASPAGGERRSQAAIAKLQATHRSQGASSSIVPVGVRPSARGYASRLTHNSRMLVLETPRLILRRLTLDDAEFIFRLVNDPSWLRFIGDKNVHNLDDARRYLREGPLDMYQRYGFGMYRVEEREGGMRGGDVRADQARHVAGRRRRLRVPPGVSRQGLCVRGRCGGARRTGIVSSACSASSRSRRRATTRRSECWRRRG